MLKWSHGARIVERRSPMTPTETLAATKRLHKAAPALLAALEWALDMATAYGEDALAGGDDAFRNGLNFNALIRKDSAFRLVSPWS
mgnify:CR=1 FL=1